ncbi:MAG: 5-formyltetrahydrofolate cyclo-ligase [Gammaproteobacteria bacterium]|nr:5-formyltetrahydrofolate cyclo-ligase [Gammaproteobacteria bacterium]
MSESHPETTAQIRARMRAQRAALSDNEVQSASYMITETLCRLPALQRASAIALYVAAFNEVDCAALAQRLEARGKQVYAPILRKNDLVFAPAGSARIFNKNRYGIPEPAHRQSELRTPQQLDIIVTPLVAFDRRCNRIGMGGGYYDRTLAFKKHRRNWRRPLAVGVAYSFQRVGAIQANTWDIPLDVVITEKESYGSY